MKIILVILAVIIIYVVYVYVRIFVASHDSPLPVITQVDIEQGQGSPLRYIAAGDSTAVGQGASSVEHTYPRLIAAELAKHNHVVYRNIAARGAQTADVINNQLKQIIEFNPDIITISISANDVTHLKSNDRIFKTYRTILDELTQKTQAKIYITGAPNFNGASLLPWPYIQLLEAKSKSFNQQLTQLETARVKIIPIHDFGWDQFPDRSVTYSADHFHPNDIGYQNWAKAFLSKMQQ